MAGNGHRMTCGISDVDIYVVVGYIVLRFLRGFMMCCFVSILTLLLLVLFVSCPVLGEQLGLFSLSSPCYAREPRGRLHGSKSFLYVVEMCCVTLWVMCFC